jgi:hypothetical protein
MKLKSFVIVPLLALTLASCGVQPSQTTQTTQPSQTTQTTQTTEGADALALVPAWQAEAPAELSELPSGMLTDDQQKLFQAAWRMYDGCGGGCGAGYIRDYSQTISVTPEGCDCAYTYALDKGFSTYDAFSAALHAAFTDDYCDTLLAFDGGVPLLREKDGKLWSLDADRGANIEYMSVSYEPVSSSDSAIEFRMIGHYAPLDDKGNHDEAKSYTTDYSIKMEKTAGGWRFSSFAIPY